MANIDKQFTKTPAFRLIIVFVLILGMFFLLVVKLYNLQIILGDFLQNQIVGTTLKEISVSAPRGSIYDRYGRPLAVNTSSFTVNIDPSVNVENLNDVILKLVNILEKNDEEIVDDFPISAEKPYIFLFNDNEHSEIRWKKDMNLDEKLSAEECFDTLKTRKSFAIDPELSDEDVRKILVQRCELYKKRYSQFIPLTVSYDIKKETIGAIEEEKSSLPGVYIDVEALRNYPKGEYFSHILGYIRGITEEELAIYKDKGYTLTDLIGKDGIEKAFELELNGTDGKTFVEVDSQGRRINTLTDNAVDPIAGNNILLTLDTNLQERTYDSLCEALAESQIAKLTGKNKKYNYSALQLFQSIVKSDNLEIDGVLKSDSSTSPEQYILKEYILSVNAEAASDYSNAREILSEGLKKGTVKQKQILLAMIEQEIFPADEDFIKRVSNSSLSPLQAVIDKLRTGEITPEMTALDPCTGSVVITDIENGDVLAAVSYPSYDNNKFVNNFDNKYYNKLNGNTYTTPLVNRPFTEPRAPGSTFKMITAIAALEEGIVTPTTKIYDKGTFTDASKPYARCWIGSGSGSHGSINISQALEVSCNYFFYDVSFRMGNAKNKGTLKGIETLNKYMIDFGLNNSTGVEIYELNSNKGNDGYYISSPEYKKSIFLYRDPETPASEYNWYDGDTIRTAIGQALNNYTSATMAKYVATLANGGTRYSLHFLDKVITQDTSLIRQYEPNIELEMNIDPKNLKAVHEGMYAVANGSRGTLRGHFSGFPVKVAAKSGTAEQTSSRSEHTTLVAFAPYNEPQISIAVLIPFGDNNTSPASKVAKDVILEYLGVDKEDEVIDYNVLTQ